MAFHDHFSGHAEYYTQFRPHYPPEWFAFLASLPPARERAWDCGTGSGQAAVGLARHFDQVIATDPSARQIDHAKQHAQVAYRVAPAEASGVDADSIDLVAVAQAVHWFDLPRFYAEVRRVGRAGSVLALWAYGLAEVSAEVDRVVGRLYGEILDAYWPPERRWVEERYQTLPFPFAEIASPEFFICADWQLPHLLGYLGTWSSAQRYLQANRVDPLDLIADELRAAWGQPGATHQIRWPLYARIGYVR